MFFIASMSGCGPGEGGKTPEAVVAEATAPAEGASKEGAPGSKAPAKEAPVVVEPRAIDLRAFAVLDGAEAPRQRTLANLSYRVRSDVKTAFEFQRRQFLALHWKELPGSSITEQAGSGAFSGAGFHISASVFPAGEPGIVDVMLHNHGNVELAKLPLPPAVKPVYVGPLTAMHVAEAPVAATAEACRRLLLAAGWEPHGTAGDSSYYKLGANRLTVTVASAPAQGGKTMISFLGEWMSADLPAPPDAEQVQYVDMLRRLTFETAADKGAIVDHYKRVLAKSGWKPNREETYRIDDRDEMVLRDSSGGVIVMEIRESGGKRKVSLGFVTLAELEEGRKRAQGRIEAGKKD